MESPRLVYERLAAQHVGSFWRLATDAHVRRYLLDDEVVTREWARAEVERSDRLFAARGVGLWLAFLDGEPVGFVGFRVFDDLGPEPQLLYAFLERVTGRGYATEAGEALLAHAAGLGIDEVVSAVDEPNTASVRVLAKLGFQRTGTMPGAFGNIVLMRHGLAEGV